MNQEPLDRAFPGDDDPRGVGLVAIIDAMSRPSRWQQRDWPDPQEIGWQGP